MVLTAVNTSSTYQLQLTSSQQWLPYMWNIVVEFTSNWVKLHWLSKQLMMSQWKPSTCMYQITPASKVHTILVNLLDFILHFRTCRMCNATSRWSDVPDHWMQMLWNWCNAITTIVVVIALHSSNSYANKESNPTVGPPDTSQLATC